jgi:hypothetical protein
VTVPEDMPRRVSVYARERPARGPAADYRAPGSRER